MSEKSEQTKKKLAKNADKITIVVLALILAGLAYVWWQEQNNTLGTDAASGKPANLQDRVADSPSLKMLQNMSGTPTLESDKDIQRIAQLNMFDFSTEQAESSLEQQAHDQVTQATALIAEGKTEEARPLLENAKKIIAYDPKVFTLLDQITTKSESMP